MELTGLKRCLQELTDAKISVSSLTTDRHPHVEAFIKKEQRDIPHYFDARHVVKGKTKELVLLSICCMLKAVLE